MEKYELIRSNRKTTSIEITKEGVVLVRAPFSLPVSEIEKFIIEKDSWIKKYKEVMRKRQEQIAKTGTKPMERKELEALADQALKYIPGRVAYYAKLMGVTYGRITIRNQKTRWGSCSSKGNLNFNCLLMKAPKEVLDYVVVHELAHRKEMNHSQRFWKEVEKICPDYKEHVRWLKENGHRLMEEGKV